MIDASISVDIPITHLETVKNVLIGMGYSHNQSLMQESISFYDCCYNIHDGNGYVNNLIISHSLKMFCLWS